MRFDTSQHMKLGQQMKLAPRMIQSMEVLQMPLADLQERIQQELESNPTLEIAEVDPASPEAQESIDRAREESSVRESPLDIDSGSGAREFERLERYEEANPEAAENEFDPGPDHAEFRRPLTARELEYEPSYSAAARGDRDPKMEAMSAAPARGESLQEQLRQQWALCDADAVLKPMGELLISFLEEDGYLRTPLETVRDRAVVIEGDASGEAGRMTAQGPVFGERPTVERLERALRALQLFLEPAGVGARSAAECLLLQLDAKEADVAEMGWPLQTIAHARTIVADHLEDLKQNRLPRLSEKTGLSMEQIREALGLLKRLSLSPARGMVDDAPRAIVPDAIVEYDADQDRYIAYLNETQIPALRINQEYARLGRDKAMEKKDREFVRTSVGNAQWLIDAVNQRRTTLLRVVEKVVEAQRDYFDYGPQALKPLPMTLVAEQLGIHVATVSRAVHEKYIATPRGTVPLRKMFSGGLQTKAAAPAGLKQDAAGEEGGEAGQEMAWEAVKAALREVIEGEDRKRPLSDEALVRELKKRGIEIARRTVAKYRDQLGIPTARLRKVF